MHVSRDSRLSSRLPRVCVGWAGRAARALTTLASASVLAVGALALAPAPARAEDVITTQEYFSYYHLDSARAKGYTGKGVTIALIDGPVGTSAPELKGANITDKSRCTIEASAKNKGHGLDMASILVSPYFGVAPDATLYSYQLSTANSISAGTCEKDGEKLDTFARLINQAIDDGAQIISISQGSGDDSEELKWAVARAMSEGVIIVNSAGNTAADANSDQLSHWSGVVGVSAITADGKFAEYSSWGNGVTTAAFGGPFTTRDDSDPTKFAVSNGSSNSAAIVSGLLALARQKWPDATANQILQLLTHTGLNPDHRWDMYTGYGAIDGGALVNTDPSQYPDENPLAQKEGGSSPTAQEVQDYADGLVEPNPDTLGMSYVYRGIDEEAALMDDIGPVHLGTSPRYHRK
ncbi:S8 family peptidase [Schaalia odontolytica]|uniref:Thermostable alkaline protease n=1 Tax=Schaalia odontolytica TaxID=1660 RepID=A0A2X0VQY0_9ACTO|nr:S8 family serine peptidase [Schaalia odontolytica]WMS28479.1 S8 family serine peptidase [Schaalia odontolytica]SPT56322.1 Thermostable alkaline protease precursor [Schaalia odontolytica]